MKKQDPENTTETGGAAAAAAPAKKKHKGLWWKILLIVLGVIIVVPLAFVGITTAISKGRGDRTTKDATIENDTGLVQQKGSSLYDKDGNRLILRGVNAGGMLVTEGWMVPYSAGESTNSDGSIKYDSDGMPVYPTLTQEEALAAFEANPNLTDEQRKTLVDTYRANWFSEEDFDFVKNNLGMNAIRLPFYYRDILDESDDGQTFTRKSEDEAFEYFDWFAQQCLDRDMYLILDLHGAPGGNNGYEHCGHMGQNDLWTEEVYQDATVDLWTYIAEHYTNTEPELGAAIATYDIINEPCAYLDNQNAGTQSPCYAVFDKIYDGIRSVGDEHVITIEGVWDFTNFANPEDYGWENIQYEIHLYNWNAGSIPEWLFQDYHEMKSWWGHYYDVPYYCGEFTCFENEGDWFERMDWFEKRGYSYTLWNYKLTVEGWWTTTWGVKTFEMHFEDDEKSVTADKLKANLKTDTYEDLLLVAQAVNSDNCVDSNAVTFIRDYYGLN